MSDPSHETIKSYGIFNPEDPTGVTPAIFILDKDGIIRWMYIGKNASDRPDAGLVLQALKQLP